MIWRDIGDVPLSVYIKEFTRLDSPMLAEATAIWEAAKPHSALALAIAFHEKKYDTVTDVIPQDFHNPYALAKASGGEGRARWLEFPDYALATVAWRERITSPTYKFGLYARTVTLDDLIAVYAPPSENGTARYVAVITERIAAYRLMSAAQENAVYPTYPVLMDAKTGREILVESPVPIVRKLIPLSKSWIRPGIALRSPWQWIQHETGNPGIGADAEMHYRYLMGLPAGTNVSFHFVVDDHQIIQLVPCNEVTWQAADGNGPGNMACVSCELCVNRDGNEALARRNAEYLCAGVLKANAGTSADVKRHWDFNYAQPPGERHHCPDHMMNEGYWPTFVANVDKLIKGGSSVPGVTYPDHMDAGIAARMFGAVIGEDGRAYAYREGSPISALWLASYGSHGWPAIKEVWSYDNGKRRYVRFAAGPTMFVGSDSVPVLMG